MSGARNFRRLQTDRLDLRAVSLSDLEAVHPLMADPRNVVYVPEGPSEAVDTVREWIARFSDRWDSSGLGYWTVRLRETGAVIGVGGADRRRAFWNLYYLIDASQWGHGYGTELARTAQQAAAVVDPGLPVVAWIHAENTASQRVARHLGLCDYGLREPQHWDGTPMHYWAGQPPAPRGGPSAA